MVQACWEDVSSIFEEPTEAITDCDKAERSVGSGFFHGIHSYKRRMKRARDEKEKGDIPGFDEHTPSVNRPRARGSRVTDSAAGSRQMLTSPSHNENLGRGAQSGFSGNAYLSPPNQEGDPNRSLRNSHRGQASYAFPTQMDNPHDGESSHDNGQVAFTAAPLPPLMAVPPQQYPDGVGPQPSSAGPSSEPRVLIGYEANGMPIMVPASVALSLMSFNMPAAAGLPPGGPGVARPVIPNPQTLLYSQLYSRPQEQQSPQHQLRHQIGTREPPAAVNHPGDTSVGSARSSSDNLDLPLGQWRPSSSTNNSFPRGGRTLGPPQLGQGPILGSEGPLLTRGEQLFSWSSAMDGIDDPDRHREVSHHSNLSSGSEIAAEPATLSAAFSPEDNSSATRAFVLYMSCDDESLSDYQCLVRKQIEVFESQPEDVESNAQGRNKPLVLNQVGIRCRHCAHLPPRHRARGSTYYPAKLHGLYQAAQNMASNHLCGYCRIIPEDLKQELRMLRDRKSPAGGGKQYWADGVKLLGVYEHEDRLRFSDD